MTKDAVHPCARHGAFWHMFGNMMATEIMEDTFEKEVVQSDVLVLTYFYLPGCAKCVVMMSAAEGLERQNANSLKLAKMNITTTQGLAKNLDVRTAPDFLIYKDGKEIQRFYGD
ncbi:MAG: thioredoxin family protein, partial [Desulfobacteraceae bacterium]